MKSEMLMIRLTPEEKAALRAVAEAYHLSVSAYIRMRLFGEPKPNS